MTEYETFLRDEAKRRGIDPDKAVIVANAEGSLTEPARRGTFSTGSSWWAYQLHYGGAGYEKYGNVAGMGNSFSALTGWAPGDPLAWKDAMRYALDTVKRGGWGPWYGAAARGITGFDGVDRAHPWNGTPVDEWDYRKVAPKPLTVAYNPDATVDAQPDDFSCSLQSAQWVLRSIGRNPARGWLEQQLVGPLSAAPIISREYGLMDATGRTIAAWLQRGSGDEMGVTFAARPVNTWEDLVALAGKGPMMLGGRTYGHWVGVRSYQDGKVQLANPSGSWKGVGQEMDRDEFDALGSWSAITVQIPKPGIGNGPSSSNNDDEILGLRQAIAYLTDDVIPMAVAAAVQRERALEEAKRVRAQYVGEKP